MIYNKQYKGFIITKQENDPVYYCKISDTQLLYNYDEKCIKAYLDVYAYLHTLINKNIVYYSIHLHTDYLKCKLLKIWGVGKKINLGIEREDLTLDSIQIPIMGYEHIVLEATDKNMDTLNNIIHYQNKIDKINKFIHTDEQKLVEAYECLTQ